MEYPHTIMPGLVRLSFDTFEVHHSVLDRWRLHSSEAMWERTKNDLTWTLCIARPSWYRGVLKPETAQAWREMGVEESILKKGANE